MLFLTAGHPLALGTLLLYGRYYEASSIVDITEGADILPSIFDAR
jgi:hypothetical protein